MNLPLYKKMIKSNLKMILSYGIGLSLYMFLIVSLFPIIAEMEDLDKMMEKMPEELMKVFGETGDFTNFGHFISGEFYGLFYIVVIAIYILLFSSKLVAKFVEQGSMSFLLSTPITRKKIVTTQFTVLVTGLLIISLLITLSGYISGLIFIDPNDFPLKEYLLINVMGTLLFIAVSSYAFMFSCFFNEERKVIAFTGLITFVSYALNLVGKLAEKVAWVQHMSLFSLFNPTAIANNEANLLISIGVFLFITIVCLVVGVKSFEKRDLPL